MGPRRGWRSPVPMLLVRLKPDDIAWPDFLDRGAPPLPQAKARGDDQRLTERMRMPGRATTGPQGATGTDYPCRRGGLEQRVNSDGTRKPILWPFVRRLRSASFNFHLA